MLKKIASIGIISALITHQAGALSFEDAAHSAYSNHEDFKIVQEKFLADIEAMPQAVAGFLPNIEAGVNLSRSRSKSASKGSLTVSPEHNRSKTHSITITQNVFNGGASMASLAMAQTGFAASRAEYFEEEQKLFLQVLDAYLKYITAQKKIAISEHKLQAASKRLDASQAQLSLGLGTRTEVAQTQAQLASAEYDKASFDAALAYAHDNFIRIVGEKPEDLSLPAIPTLPATMDEFLSLAKKLNPGLIRAQNLSKQAQHNKTVAHAKFLPSANLQAQVARKSSTGYSSSLLGSQQYSNTRQKDVSTSLSVRIPIFSQGGVEFSKMRAAKKGARRQASVYNSVKRTLETNAIKLWEEYNASQQMILAVNKAVEAEALAVEGITHEERLGLKSLLEVLKAEDRLYAVQLKAIDAEQQNILAAYQISVMIGDLTARKLGIQNSFNPEYEFKKIKTQLIGF